MIFLSRQYDKPSLDFLLIKEELEKRFPTVKCRLLTKKVELTVGALILYLPEVLKQMYHLATSTVCLVDSYIIPVSLLKHKKQLLIIQTWHAFVTVKQFGYQTLDKEGGRSKQLALSLKMHRNYDYAIAGSKMARLHFSQAFAMPLEKVLACGLPKIDWLIENQEAIKTKILQHYPDLNDKRVILYVPTFRRWQFDGSEELERCFKGSNYYLVVKPHPSDENYDKALTAKYADFSSSEMLTIAEYVVTDYSAIAFEALAIDRPVLFYVPDYERYCKENGLNIDPYQLMPGNTVQKAGELYEIISTGRYDHSDYQKVKTDYVAHEGRAVDNIVKLIGDHLNDLNSRN